MSRMNVVDSPPGTTSPSSPSSCSGSRTSTTSTPSRRSIAACSRKLPWRARTPIFGARSTGSILEAASGQPVLGRPARQLVARRELELPEDVRDVALDRLHRQAEPPRDLLVEVAARDQLEHLTLARRQLVELRVAADALARAEGVEDEAGEARREDGVALRDALDRRRELVARDRLRHVAAGAGADDGDHVLRRVRDREREETDGRSRLRDGVDDRVAAAVRKVHVEEDDLGIELLDQRHRLGDARGLADELDGLAELGPHAGAKEVVVVDEDDAPLHVVPLGRVSSTSVPSPGALVTAAVPPTRSIRATIESEMPRRSAGTAAASKPAPRSRTNTEIRSSVASAYTSTSSAPECFAPFVIASRTASASAPTRSSAGQSPALASSTRTPCSSSTSAAAAASSVASVSPCSRSP